MTTACCKYNYEGLVTGHAYTLLDVKHLSNGVTLAQIRNPWAHEKYVGPWSDSSSLWSHDLKNEAGYVNADDGVFFMEYNKYLDVFI